MASDNLWMPLSEVVTRAGGFEVLRPRLRSGGILARHAGTYLWPSGTAAGGPGNIDPASWAGAYEDAGRVIFEAVLLEGDPPACVKFFAIGIELEREPVERLFPAPAPEQTATATWVIAEAKRMKEELPPDIKITAFAGMLAHSMRKAAETNKSIRPVGAPYIKNMLRDWGLWPPASIK